jgi:Dimerisation and cyclophilin-binding domain of Mon2
MQSALPTIIHLLPPLSQRASGDVEVQLKILQSIASLLSSSSAYPSQINGEPLANLLRICFAYAESSRVAVVSSTAAATLRSAVMSVCEKVVEEDKRLDAIKGGGEEGELIPPCNALQSREVD